MSKKFLISSICVASLLFLLFTIIFVLVVTNGNAPFSVDRAVQNWAYENRGEKGDFVFWFFRIVTEFGYTYFVVAFLIIMAIVWKFNKKTWFLVGSVALAFGVHEIIKLIVKRPRPDASMQWMIETSSSFPSGHSNTAICLFVLVIFFVLISKTMPRWSKILITSLSVCACLLVPASRIILGMHYFSDVVAGMCLGGFFAVLCIIFFKLCENKQKKKQILNNKNS